MEAGLLDSAQSRRLRSIRTAERSYFDGKRKRSSRRFPFGGISEHSIRLLSLTRWMSLRRVSRARTSVALEAASASRGLDRGSGRKSCEWFARWDRDSSSWRTPQCLLLGGLEEFSETWPTSGSMRNGECFPRPPVEHGTEEDDSFYWPTLTKSAGAQGQMEPDGKRGQSLIGAVRGQLWPTLTKKGNYNRKGVSEKSGDGLVTALRMMPTLLARDSRSPKGSARKREGSKPLVEQVGGTLNPEWAEWWMGFPIGFSGLKPLGIRRFRRWLRAHGRRFKEDSKGVGVG